MEFYGVHLDDFTGEHLLECVSPLFSLPADTQFMLIVSDGDEEEGVMASVKEIIHEFFMFEQFLRPDGWYIKGVC